jgi:dTMP kinase
VLVAIEGIDGSGKGTQAARLVEQLENRNVSARLIGFPRYERTFFGRAVGRFLNGEFGTLAEANPYLVSLLFAGDRFESRDDLRAAAEQCRVVVLDRYVGSNIAHQGAKLDANARPGLIEFVEQLEFGIYQLPRADLNILLDLPAETARTLVGRKNARGYTDRAHDLQEEDVAYLDAVRRMYLDLARDAADWVVVECLQAGRLRSIEEIAEEILHTVLHAAES